MKNVRAFCEHTSLQYPFPISLVDVLEDMMAPVCHSSRRGWNDGSKWKDPIVDWLVP